MKRALLILLAVAALAVALGVSNSQAGPAIPQPGSSTVIPEPGDDECLQLPDPCDVIEYAGPAPTPLEDGGGQVTQFCHPGRYEQTAIMDGPLGFRVRVCRWGVTLTYPAPGWYSWYWGNIDGCAPPNIYACDRWRPWPEG